MTWLAIHLDFGLRLVESPTEARVVGELLSRPCFAALSRVSARAKDRWSRYKAASAAAIAEYLLDPSLDAVALDTKRGSDIVATAEIENGVRERSTRAAATRHPATIVIPYVANDLEAVLAGVHELARTLQAAAGYIALEPSYGFAHEVALGGARPRERVGVSQQRFRERRGRSWYEERRATEVIGIEWGNFLGPGHLARLDLDAIRTAGAFARVAQVAPELLYLQVTEDPADDLTEEFELRLETARKALASVLADVSDVSLE